MTHGNEVSAFKINYEVLDPKFSSNLPFFVTRCHYPRSGSCLCHGFLTNI